MHICTLSQWRWKPDVSGCNWGFRPVWKGLYFLFFLKLDTSRSLKTGRASCAAGHSWLNMASDTMVHPSPRSVRLLCLFSCPHQINRHWSRHAGDKEQQPGHIKAECPLRADDKERTEGAGHVWCVWPQKDGERERETPETLQVCRRPNLLHLCYKTSCESTELHETRTCLCIYTKECMEQMQTNTMHRSVSYS